MNSGQYAPSQAVTMHHGQRSACTICRGVFTVFTDIMIPEQELVLEGGILVDLGAIGSRIKAAREKKHLTQDDLAAIVDLSSTHISVIERGVKPPKLETFVNIANALGVSADTLLQDVVEHSSEGIASELAAEIMKLPAKERSRIINAVRALTE